MDLEKLKDAKKLSMPWMSSCIRGGEKSIQRLFPERFLLSLFVCFNFRFLRRTRERAIVNCNDIDKVTNNQGPSQIELGEH